MKTLAIAAATFAFGFTFTAQAADARAADPFAKARAEWNKPAPPFRIIGNVYYVGTADLGIFLIVTPKGHVLIDAGTEETPALVKKSIETLGFEPGDIEILLNSHAHFDHAGGLAEMKRATGA